MPSLQELDQYNNAEAADQDGDIEGRSYFWCVVLVLLFLLNLCIFGEGKTKIEKTSVVFFDYIIAFVC